VLEPRSISIHIARSRVGNPGTSSEG
jgi:hypothetical protein